MAGKEVAQEYLRAGQAAAELGVGVQTLHYYEREGFIPVPPRSEAGYRLFPPELMERLRFIRRAQALGLSLTEIRETLELVAIGESPCGRVQTALAERLAEVDRRLEQLTSFRNDVAELIAAAPKLQSATSGGGVCAIVEGAAPIRGSNLVSKPLNRYREAPGTP
jgi:DNA-binding transcriptional MerR regulator